MAVSTIELERLIEKYERVRTRLIRLKNFCIARRKFTKAGPLQEQLNHHISLFDKFAIIQGRIE